MGDNEIPMRMRTDLFVSPVKNIYIHIRVLSRIFFGRWRGGGGGGGWGDNDMCSQNQPNVVCWLNFGSNT